MAEISKDFISRFHSLQGATVKERQQSLFKLLHNYQSILAKQPAELQLIASNLKATTHLERIFRIDFLIYFRCFQQLYQEYKNGDEITLSKVARREWFFLEVFKNVSCQELVSRVLPSLSHNVRLRILGKLPSGEQRNDEIFDAVLKRYGIFLATVCLHKCSPKKIQNILKTQPIKLTQHQLKIVYNKDPHLIYVYVEERKKREGGVGFMNNNPIFMYIAQKNPEMFSKLMNTYDFNVRLGRRTTKKYIQSQQNNVLDKPVPYVRVLNLPALVRKLGSPLKEMLFKNELCWSLITHYPKNQRFDIYRSAYDKFYYHKFGVNIDTLSEIELGMITDPILREELAVRKFEENNNEQYLKYTTPGYCFKEFFKKLNNMNVSDRANYVEIAAECCMRNADNKSFLKLCELVSVRFKNDDSNVRQRFLSAIGGDSKFLEKLDGRHWKAIEQMLAVRDDWFCNESLLKAMLVQYLINNDRPIRQYITKKTNWLDEIINGQDVWKDPKIPKKIICQMIETGFPEDEEGLTPTPQELDCALAYACKIYNRKNPKDVVDIYTNNRFVESARTVLEDENVRYVEDRYKSGIAYIVSRKNSKELVDLQKLYFKALKMFGKERQCLWFLKHDPHTFRDNLDQFLTNFPEACSINQRRIWRLIKKYSHLELDKKTADFCKLKLSEESYKNKQELVKALSILTDSTAHLKLMKAYEPKSSKVDLTDDKIKEFYLLQCELVKYLHRVDSPATLLPLIMKFSVGDYLKSALGPLYSLAYKLPNEEAIKCVDELSKSKAVSVKKHSMHLSCVICDQQTAHRCLKNASVPSLLAALKYFVKNPSDALWQFIEAKISGSTKEELDVFKWAASITIPSNYKGRYVEAVWKVLDKHENKQIKQILIGKFDKETIEKLTPAFAYRLIESSIFKIEEADDFVANLLIHFDHAEKFEFFGKILRQFKEDHWNHKVKRRAARTKLHNFILKLFKIYVDLKKTDVNFATEMESLFVAVFDTVEAFEEVVMVSVLKLKGETVENCSKLLIELRECLVEKHGRFATNWLADALNCHVLQLLFNNDGKKIELCYYLRKFKRSVDDYWLIVKLLPKSEPKDIKHFSFYNEVLDELEQQSDDLVRIPFNLYLKLD